MHKIFIILLFSIVTLSLKAQDQNYTLQDFYRNKPLLDHKIDSVYNTLSLDQQIAQMIITSAGELGKPDAVVEKLVKEGKVGSVIYLKGSKTAHSNRSNTLNKIAKENGTLPLIFSIDAEPSLYSGRVQGGAKVIKTAEIKTIEESDSIAHLINRELKEMGIHHNYAPVCDLGTDNAAITNRSYGSNPKKVTELSQSFIKATQQDQIVATAKHFPGHGLVEGDSHKQSVYINGELKELSVYPSLIDQGVISILVGHMTIINNEKYNTNNLPATCSPKIVNGLLKNELGFKGIAITDALNIMKAVTIIPNAPLKASMAGCDMLCMPIDENNVIETIRNEIKVNETYKKQVEVSVKKIIRLKYCLNLL